MTVYSLYPMLHGVTSHTTENSCSIRFLERIELTLVHFYLLWWQSSWKLPSAVDTRCPIKNLLYILTSYKVVLTLPIPLQLTSFARYPLLEFLAESTGMLVNETLIQPYHWQCLLRCPTKMKESNAMCLYCDHSLLTRSSNSVLFNVLLLFYRTSGLSPAPTQLPIHWVPNSFPGIRRPKRETDRLLQSDAELYFCPYMPSRCEKVQLYLLYLFLPLCTLNSSRKVIWFTSQKFGFCTL
jgi:hypothetical protein